MRENKKDRIARLSKVEHILFQCPEGLTIREIAERCEVSAKTTRRDLKALDEDIGVPIWQEKGKWGITPGYFLQPISFTLPEAMSFFLSARLLAAYSNEYNPNIDSAFTKLSSAVPEQLRGQIASTLKWMQNYDRDDYFCRVMDILSNAWIYGRKVKIRYQAMGRKEATERIMEPYFIQPAALERANYVIGYCHKEKTVLTFKVKRITSIELLEEHYKIPEDFDANEFLASAWGITVSGNAKKIELKFYPEVGRIAQETNWHPSQKTKMQPDGSAIVTFNVAITQEFISYILWWGDKVEVLEPKGLREEVMRVVGEMGKIYTKNKIGG